MIDQLNLFESRCCCFCVLLVGHCCRYGSVWENVFPTLELWLTDSILSVYGRYRVSVIFSTSIFDTTWAADSSPESFFIDLTHTSLTMKVTQMLMDSMPVVVDTAESLSNNVESNQHFFFLGEFSSSRKLMEEPPHQKKKKRTSKQTSDDHCLAHHRCTYFSFDFFLIRLYNNKIISESS